ncbi:uncharacterized protein F4807DRAFT_465860 [Annulohypoxylon truncatum]|uniref:uncharacterized protein n=1 Tax=Annulohypoxylon truncatum TaxID=327061 RepID=UPI0020078603|nr:uncharacterized protein F4807DRAFT_465860 [Annulohypoxylon truncatum]KAI1204235.1 hypothetical protein F4807DRAFT_465860 [Annulohypoxylon truncatum]
MRRRACNAPLFQGNDCGSPYATKDFLPYVPTIKSVDFDVDNPRFEFVYANNLCSIGEDRCACADVSRDLEGEKACKSAFPLPGEEKQGGVVAVGFGWCDTELPVFTFVL